MITNFSTYVTEKIDVSKLNTNKIYFLKHPNSYEYLIVVNDNKLQGFVTPGFQTDEMEEQNTHTIGTVVGKGYGDLLYGALMKYYGPVIASDNMSDQAKISWVTKMKDPDYVSETIDDIGFYSVYPEERILNQVVDLKFEIKKRFIINKAEELNNFKDMCDQIQKKHDYMSKEFMQDKHMNYTFGESRDRFEWISKTSTDKVIKVHHTKDSKDFFKTYKIPFAEKDNSNAKKFLSLTI